MVDCGELEHITIRRMEGQLERLRRLQNNTVLAKQEAYHTVICAMDRSPHDHEYVKDAIMSHHYTINQDYELRQMILSVEKSLLFGRLGYD